MTYSILNKIFVTFSTGQNSQSTKKNRIKNMNALNGESEVERARLYSFNHILRINEDFAIFLISL